MRLSHHSEGFCSPTFTSFSAHKSFIKGINSCMNLFLIPVNVLFLHHCSDSKVYSYFFHFFTTHTILKPHVIFALITSLKFAFMSGFYAKSNHFCSSHSLTFVLYFTKLITLVFMKSPSFLYFLQIIHSYFSAISITITSYFSFLTCHPPLTICRSYPDAAFSPLFLRCLYSLEFSIIQ